MIGKVKRYFLWAYSIVMYGKMWMGFQRKPIWCAYYCWYDGDHWALHLGWFYIEVEH